jgi:glycosyltransferase involved in cell wall biosynthesis
MIYLFSAGTPVVGTNVGAAKEIIGNSGEVTDPDPEALGEKIKQILSSGLLERYASNTESDLEKYRYKKVQSHFDDLYRSVY